MVKTSGSSWGVLGVMESPFASAAVLPLMWLNEGRRNKMCPSQ